MTVAELVKDKREWLAWSQAELAERAGCTPEMISMIEGGKRGEKDMSFQLAMGLCKALKIRPEVLWRSMGDESED